MTDSQTRADAGWNFDNSYARLPESLFTRIDPEAVRSPQLVAFNRRLAESMGLNMDALEGEAGASIFAGNNLIQGSAPIAQAYAGHQFGHFTMLGDGRAVLLGEHITPSGDRLDIQLKGSGRTPYSRRGDGRAALGPMLREYIISEAMNALGIPTTRSLAVTTTGETILRETTLPGAVLTRVAASHIRVGTFQYAANYGSATDLRALADYTIARHYPYIEKLDDSDIANHGGQNRYFHLLKEVIRRQAELIAKWQLVGFIHGVMNTDNMAISGETIDYGPCAFMDVYNPETVFSSIDTYGRYAYGNQPKMAGWNLARFAEALVPLIHTDTDRAVDLAQQAISEFPDLFNSYWMSGMRAKLGIADEETQDEELVRDLLELMEKHKSDYTNTFLALTYDQHDEKELSQQAAAATEWFDTTDFREWQERWHARIGDGPEQKEAARQLMRSHNPAVIPRNHRVEEALEAAVKNGDYSVMTRLLDALAGPFEHRTDQLEYMSPSGPSSCDYRTFCGT